jgi:hypothetical protein
MICCLETVRDDVLIMRCGPLDSQRAPALSDESTRKRDEWTGGQNPKYSRQDAEERQARHQKISSCLDALCFI